MPQGLASLPQSSRHMLMLRHENEGRRIGGVGAIPKLKAAALITMPTDKFECLIDRPAERLSMPCIDLDLHGPHLYAA
jgi:hypothetical protein